MKKFILIAAFISASMLFSLNVNAQVVDKIPKAPHEKVERPPKPKSGNWQWVPGHWDWKSQSKVYEWKKPRWRKVPKGKSKWHKGYWKKVKKGWRWEEGYWV